MKECLEFKSYVSNYVPELGYLTKEEIKFLPIDHSLAELAAQKVLDYEQNEYLPGYIKVTYGQHSILSDQHETDDLLDTWDGLSYIVKNQATEDKYPITLLGYPIDVFILKKQKQFYFEINNGKMVKRSLSIPKEELLKSILKGYRDFIDFCKKESLTFGEDTVYNSSLKTLNNINNMEKMKNKK
ncbi:hypothetical protein ACFFIX_20255 [Metabacillus herbersteinensis]|uniref:Uncharacterized protein n=1 Tax=Metabacillus herbersteinensis TaxID=283816 RepID=A0ABV6GJ54_9BACI